MHLNSVINTLSQHTFYMIYITNVVIGSKIIGSIIHLYANDWQNDIE